MKITSRKYIQFGCGFSAPEEWCNFDASWTLLYEKIPLIGRIYTKNNIRFPVNIRYGDILKGLPVADNSCLAVYCSHVLEHLTIDEMEIALLNVYKMLETGGVFRLVLPDLEFAIQQYCSDPSPLAAETFMRVTGLGKIRRPGTLPELLTLWLGRSQHLWMWDYKSLTARLAKVGFNQIRRACMGDAPDPMFRLVEEADRWENCLGIECRK